METGTILSSVKAPKRKSALDAPPPRLLAGFVRRIRVGIIKPAMERLIPAGWLRRIRHHQSRKWDSKFQRLPAVEVFTAIYKEGRWGASPRGGFYSGTGSHDPKVVLPYVEAVAGFLQSLPAPPSLVDLGCGDFNIGRQLRRHCGKYLGCDVVPALIARNQAEFSEAEVDFRCLDIAKDDLPDADVALLRQVLQHLSNAQILEIVPKLQRYRFLILSEHLSGEPNFRPNIEKPAGALVRLFERSGVVLTEPPFNLKIKSETILCSDAQEIDGSPGLVRTTLYELCRMNSGDRGRFPPRTAGAKACEEVMEEPRVRIADETTSGHRTAKPLVSVIIVNYNYGRYLKQCIDSVLAQDYEPKEVMVVDDGSTDESRAILQSYSGRLTIRFQSNGGVISATNAGFGMSNGSIVIFVDADDYLLPGAVEAHARALQEPGVVRSQAYMTVLHGAELSGARMPGQRAAEGDLRNELLQRGPGCYVCAPTSGNAWARSFLERIFPLPENLPGVAQDCLLMDAAPLFGKTITLNRRVAVYRMHGANASGELAKVNLENIQKILLRYEKRSERLGEIASDLGHRPFLSEWNSSNWRILTLQHLRGRLSCGGEAPGIAEHLRSAFKVRGNPLKKSMVAGTILSIRIAPTKLAVGIASRVIHLGTM